MIDHEAGAAQGRKDTAAHAPHRWSPGLRAAPLMLAVAGVALILVVTARNGIGVTPDSVIYLAAAESLLNVDGLRGPDSDAFVVFPPLFPAALALFSCGVIDLTTVARLLNALCFGVTIASAGWAVGRITGSRRDAALTAAVVLLSPPLLTTALHIWSEPLFTALAMLSLCCLTAAPARRSAGLTVASTATAAAAALTRYIGVILPLSNAAALVCGSGPHAVRLRRAGVALIACMPLMLWLARNLAVSGTVAGDRFPAAASWDENTRAAVESVLRWLVPADLAMRWRALLALSVGAAVATACVASACRHGAARGAMARTLPFATFALLYLAYLIAAASITALDPIDDRLIAPLLPPLAVIAVVTAHAGGHLQGRVGRFVAPVVMALAILWLFGSGIQMARLLQRIEADGIGGYTSGRWRESEALAALRHSAPAAALYSNDPFAVRYWTGRAARLSPRRYPYRSPETAIDDLPALREALASGAPVELLWFDDVPRDFLLSLEDLRLMLELEPVIQADDGTVYRVIGVR